MAFPGQRVRIVSLAGGRGLKEHLAALGLNEGLEIEVIKRGAPGPFLIAVKDTRLAIGAGMANKIMVNRNNKKWVGKNDFR